MTPLDVPTLDLTIYSNLSVHDTQGGDRDPHHACTYCMFTSNNCLFISYKREFLREVIFYKFADLWSLLKLSRFN
jgi:hypothetical protein